MPHVSTLDAGLVDIRFGSATTSEWSQAPLPGSPESGDRFGTVLAAGDFNGDGADDLAIGVPDEDVNGAGDAGAVNVIYGTPSQCLP